MKIIALESSAQPGSVAFFQDDTLLYQSEFPGRQRMAQLFSVELSRGLEKLAWKPHEVELFAVCLGPGSFTGLRIGITAAKSYSYVTGCDTLAVNTLEIIATQVPYPSKSVWAVLDAQRRQLFAASFEVEGQNLIRRRETSIVDDTQWIRDLNEGDTVTGTGLRRLAHELPHGRGVDVLDQRYWTPRAETLGRIAYQRYLVGERSDKWKLVPDYFRPSAAEEKLKLS